MERRRIKEVIDMHKKVIIKIGTSVITKENGELDIAAIKQIVEQVSWLRKKNIDVILVSSGAMGAGRGVISLGKKSNDVTKRQVLAAVGQVSLMKTYQKLFDAFGLVCAQVLASKDDFRDRQHFLNMKNCFEGLLDNKVIPIVNENDVVSVTELMFTDNDELAGLVAGMMDVDVVMLLSTVGGVIDGDGDVIAQFDPGDTRWRDVISSHKSSFGRGGMLTKCKMAQKLSAIGITTHILDGRQKGSVVDAMKNRDIGTTFVAQKRSLSAVKKWIAYSDGYEKGVVHINECADPVLRDKQKARSLLPVGVTKIDGYFEKGDVVKIKNHKNKTIGFGKVEYGSSVAYSYIGQKGRKPLVHYDYLYLV